MKQYLLFAGREGTDLKGVHGFVGDFNSFADAFVSLVDQQTPSQWWHVLDTATGEVVERRHLRVHNGMIGFERSHWVVGQPTKGEAKAIPSGAPISAIASVEPVSAPTSAGEKAKEAPAPADVSPTVVALPKAAALTTLEQDLRSVVTSSHTNGKATGHANGTAAGH